MASLQRSFEYQGDINKISIGKINLEIHLPQFSYFATNTNFANFKRRLDGYKTITQAQKLSQDAYQIELPVSMITGEQLNSKYGFFRFHKTEPLFYDDLRDFVFEIRCRIVDEFGTEIGETIFDAIYGFKSSPPLDRNYAKEVKEFIDRYGVLDQVIDSGIEDLVATESDKIFLLNKSAYDELREKVEKIAKKISRRAARVETEKDYLLSLIEVLVDLSGAQPRLIENVDKFTQESLRTFLMQREVKNPDEVIKVVKKNFNTLFDFLISVPEIKTVDIGGTFTVFTNEAISKRDLEFYDLAVEYPTLNSGIKIIRYDWNENDNDLADNAIAISFTDNGPITLMSIDNVVSVIVKGFDGSTLWSKTFDPSDPSLQRLEIEVPLYNPVTMDTISADGILGNVKRLRGKVIQFGNKYDLNKLTIVIQAKKGDSDVWRIVGSAVTDSSGNFSLNYPYGKYLEAQALVSLMPNSPANIEVNPDRPADETISDDFIYLLLQDNEVVESDSEEQDEDCDCDSPNKTKRLPDQADLIESDEYTQDIGGTCLNLSTPNRTLREYSYNAIVRISDPDVANYILRKNIDGNTVTYRLERDGQKLQRKMVDLDNPIHWEDAPDAKSNLSLYQAVTVATGHILYFKSVFKADGYSLGDLVYSLPLAPGQKKQIVVFESSHSLIGAESQTMTQKENLSAELISDRFILDEISGGISEDLRGGSSASTEGFSAGLGAGVSFGGIGGSLGVAGGYSNSKSSASQNSSKYVTQYFNEKLRQSITQRGDSYRQLNASVVTTTEERQAYGVTSEVVANHNHCHSITMMYFEVLRHFAIFQELSHVEECVFVPLLMTHFTTENIHKWRDVLASTLLPIPSSTYLQPHSLILKGRQHPLLKAFDANERIKTNYTRVDFPPEGETYADGMITQIRGRLTMNVNIPRPKTRYDRIKSLPIISKTVTHEEIDVEGSIKKNAILAAIPFGFLFAGSESRTVEEEILVAGPIFDQFMTLDANYALVPPSRCIRVINFSTSIRLSAGTTMTAGEGFFDEGEIDKKLWMGYAEILGYTGPEGVYEMLNYYFSGRLISEWDEIFYNDILPVVFSNIVDSISIHWGEVITSREGDMETIRHSGDGFNLDFSAESKYAGGNRQIDVNFNSQGEVGKKRSALPLYISISSSNFDAVALKNHIKLNIGKVSIDYATAHFQGVLYRGFVNDDLLDGTNLYIPLNSRDKLNPRKEDEYLVNLLIENLNSNLEYYNKKLWSYLDRDRRFMLLDGFNIEVYNASGRSSGFRSLASVIKNELITITGNSLVFPVADGYKVGQAFIVEDDGDDVQQEISLFDHYKPLTPIPPYRISVPTRGVFMEAVQGACDACEMVKENSSQDWDKFRTEEPTSISPIVTPTPMITEYKPQYKDFAPPLVNIQNAPDAPAPAAGLSQLAELLGKSGVFNDITGLQGNQRNVLETYLSNQANARAFAEMAKGLATQQHNTQHSDDFMQRTEDARDRGAISEDDYRDLTRQHLQQQIDGGESARESAQVERERSRPSLTSAAIDAANRGQSVRAERTDADGNSEVVTVSERDREGSPVNVVHQIDPIEQPFSMACWATAATMMMNWKNGSSLSIEEVLRDAGNHLDPPDEDYYINILNGNTGLAADEKEQFISTLGMVGAPPASFTLSQYVDWLQNYGPLWITTDDDSGESFSPHARVLFRIEGDTESDDRNVYFTFVDPADGTSETDTFEEFISHFEQMATDIESDSELFVQVVHFQDRIQAAEGRPGEYRTPSTPCRAFTPSEFNKIVLDMALLDPPTGTSSVPDVLAFRNWGATRGASGAGRGVIHFVQTGRTYGCRNPNDLVSIVLHETGRNNASGDSLPGVTSRNLGVHFLIESDGKIVQFNDIVDKVPHGGRSWNDISVGIEFANAHFFGDAGEQLNLAWEGADYQVPTRAALESCYSLVDWLINHLPNVQNRYLNLMNIPSGEHAGERAWHIHYHPSASAGNLHSPSPGIISHNVYAKQKPDGWFQALYCWCRSPIGENLSSPDALERAKSIAAAPSDRVVNIDGNIFILL